MIRRFLTLLSLAGAVSAAHAASSPDSLRYRLPEISVTGTRLGEDPLGLPMAVTVAGARSFANSRHFALDEALGMVPGVQAQSRAGGGDLRLTIRGFGARASGDKSNSSTIRGIKVLVDGIPETDPDGRSALDLVDLAAASRIEVVRSNASTLFGNASGGLINIETGARNGPASVSSDNIVGAFGFRKNSVTGILPLGSAWFSATASNSRFDGWRDHTRSRTTQFSSVLTAQLGESSVLRLLAGASSNKFQIPGALTQQQFDSAATQANAMYKSRDERRYNRVGRLGLNLVTDFGPHSTLEATAYVTPKVLQRSERGTYRDFNRYHVGGGMVYRWRANPDGTGPRFTAGLDEAYLDGSILFYNLADGQRGDSLRTNKREGADALGVFAQAQVDLTDRLQLTAGGRFDRQRYIYEEFAAGRLAATVGQKLNLDRVTPKFAALYRVTPTHSVYFTLGGGIEAPAFNEVDPPDTLKDAYLNPFLKPMTSLTVELGAKGYRALEGEGLLRRVSYNAAAYRIGIRDEIVPYNGGGYFFSAGRSRRYGFELGGEAGLANSLALSLAFTWMDAKYQEYSNELGDFSGNKVPGIANTMLNARLAFEPKPGCMAEIGAQHLGSYFANDANTLSVPSYVLLNAAAGYRVEAGKLQVQARAGVNNLADRKYAASAFINPATAAFLEPGLKRNAFVSLGVKLLP
ncbi:MAG: TonB-dependent receptor [Candidatus Eisenbacteria bacterium]|nr:TonB-dependent receptor [Candidatus Eisenbacteria bacterium]